MGWFILACVCLAIGLMPLVIFMMMWIIPAAILGLVVIGVAALIGGDNTPFSSNK